MEKKAFCEWFAEVRIASGFSSQRKLAKATGLSNGLISSIESGHVPPVKTLKVLAEHLNATSLEEMVNKAYLSTDE